MTINIKTFEKQFQKEYNFLYENDNNVAGYKEAVEAFDEFLKEKHYELKKLRSSIRRAKKKVSPCAS